MKDFVVIYIIGAIVTFLLHIFHIILFWALAWLTNEHILWRNLKKLERPDHKEWYVKLAGNSFLIAIDVFFSWLGAPLIAWRIFARLLTTAKMRFATVPEEIKKLRFPLWNNPELSTEAVWAYTSALSVLNGDAVDWGTLVWQLRHLKLVAPNVDEQKAIEIFEGLKVMPPRPVWQPTSD